MGMLALFLAMVPLMVIFQAKAVNQYQLSIDPIKSTGSRDKTLTYQVGFTNNSNASVNGTLSAVAPTGWSVSFDSSDLSGITAGSSVSTAVHITSADNAANGVYHFDIDLRESGNLLATTRADYIVFDPTPPSGTDLYQKAFGKELPDGGETYDITPELFFTGESGGFGSSGTIAGENFGKIIAQHSDSHIAAKLYDNGVVGHLWSEMAGWLIMDADGYPGASNATATDFGVNVSKKTITDSTTGQEVIINNLSGKAWGESAGWIYFSCNDLGNVPASCNVPALDCTTRDTVDKNNFNVCIDQSGKSHGHAWSENMGWIDFETIEISQPTYRLEISHDEANWNNPLYIQSIVGYSFETPELQDGETYYWRVCILSDEGACSDYSVPLSFTIKAEPEVNIISPLDGTTLSVNNTDFKFSVLDKPDTNLENILTIEKYNETTSSWDIYHTATINTTIEDEKPVEETYNGVVFTNGNYRWKILSKDHDPDNETETAYQNFTVDIPAPSINCANPTDNESIYDSTPLLNFTLNNFSENQFNWKIIVDNNSDFSSAEISTAYAVSTNNSVDYQVIGTNGLDPSTYNWKITVQDANKNIIEKTCTFTISNNAPVLNDLSTWIEGNGVEIADGGDTYDATPAIHTELTDDEEGAVYDLKAEIAEDSDFNSVVWEENKENVEQGDHDFYVDQGLTRNKTYFWHVIATDASGAASTSKEDHPWSFNLLESQEAGFGNIGTILIKFAGDDAEKIKHRYADSSAGHINFNPAGLGVYVKNDKLLGYAFSDTIGKIRMNCEESDDMNQDGVVEIEDDNICNSNNFGVLNDGLGNLSGKAWIENSNSYLYFDGDTYFCDKLAMCTEGAGAASQIAVSIDSNGEFSGMAWNDSLGWVDFNKHEDITGDDAMINYYAITEWTPDSNKPISGGDGGDDGDVDTADNYIFSATDNKDPFVIATENHASDSGFYCVGGVLVNDGKTTLKLVNLDGSEINTTEKNYTFACRNPIGDCTSGNCYYREAVLDLSPSNNALLNDLSTKTGVYKITGDIADNAGNTLSVPEDTYQIVAGAPVMIAPVVNGDDNLFANGKDYYDVYIPAIYDRFGNLVQSETVAAGPKAGQALKEVSIDLTLFNTVDYDQYEPALEADLGDPVKYDNGTLIATRNWASKLDVLNFEVDGSAHLITVESYAPTYYNQLDDNDSNNLILSSVVMNIENVAGIGEIGDCANISACTYNANQYLDFKAMISGNLVDENHNLINLSTLSFANNGDTLLNLKINNDDDSTIVDQADLFVKFIATDKESNMSIPEIVYNQTRLVKQNDDDSTIWDDISSGYCEEDCVDSYLEEASATYGGSAFETILSYNLLNSSYYNTQWENGTPTYYTLATVYTLLDSIDVDAENIANNMKAYVSYHNGGSKVVRHILLTGSDANTLTYKELSVEGLAGGNKIDADIISNPDQTRFIETGQAVTFADMSELIRRNVAATTKGQSTLTDVNNDTITVNSWDDIFNSDNPVKQAEILQNGKVAWFHGQDFTLEIDGDLKIPDNGNYTIVVTGGNVYLKGNIINATGNAMASGSNKGMLGIIVLKTPSYALSNADDKATESGNFLINPNVRNIKASLIAEGSILSYDGEVFDGFSDDIINRLDQQLYIKGTIMSRNTIGGATHKDADGNLDPQIPDYEFLWMPDECSDFDNCADKQSVATRFDLAKLRRYSALAADSALDVDSDYQSSSVIIRYDDYIKSNTPPLFNVSSDLNFYQIIK